MLRPQIFSPDSTIPDIDEWSEHFQINEDAEITSSTEIGEVTVRILRFNDFERVLERQGLIELSLWKVKSTI